ncbi:DUF1178 family protein [Thalassobius sp. S69A]|uniref:DUF1178 family protein n=1 Tax=unclassified Thalassovita TaxID=2619711 RepID=UPI000C4BCF45|nr:hypothetical protein [Paracoccaceae bacterium]
MIQYTLKCDQDHRFDSWFQSGEAFDKLKAAGMVACAVCGSANVDKAIMAPRVRPARTASAASPETPPSAPTLGTPANDTERAISELKRKIEENSEYVGQNFAQEARAMHEGDSPERAIHGEAKPEEAKKLIEEGVPVLPLPFLSGRKTN